MKKFSPLSVALITALITAIICMLISLVVVERTPRVGNTVSEKVSIDDSQTTDVNGTGSSSSTNIVTRTFVYLGARSKLYPTEDAVSSTGIFLDTFDTDELAELIDSAAFPYKQEYVATTSSTNPVRYMIKTTSGSIYWVEP